MYEDLKIFLSEDKLKPYLIMVNNDKEKAIKLYELNLEISSQFYKLIQILEVSSRNIFNKYISVKYYDNWLFNEIYWMVMIIKHII